MRESYSRWPMELDMSCASPKRFCPWHWRAAVLASKRGQAAPRRISAHCLGQIGFSATGFRRNRNGFLQPMNAWRTLFAAAVDVDIPRISGAATMRSLKRLLYVALASTVLPTPHASAAESAYPSKPLRLIVPYAPGGGVDGVGRLMAQDLAPRLGQQIVIDNRGGGGGIIGLDIAAHSVPDRYTLLVGSVAVTSMPGLCRRLPLEPIRDFAPITISVTGTYLLAVNVGLPVESVKELIALARASPGKLNFGSSGGGSTIHLAGEMFKSMAKGDITHVPYKSAGLAMTDMIGGHIQMMFAPVLVLLAMAKAGRIKALGVT